jgi:hypothetical protein
MASLRGRFRERPADQSQPYDAYIHLAYKFFWKQQKQLVKTTYDLRAQPRPVS